MFRAGCPQDDERSRFGGSEKLPIAALRSGIPEETYPPNPPWVGLGILDSHGSPNPWLSFYPRYRPHRQRKLHRSVATSTQPRALAAVKVK